MSIVCPARAAAWLLLFGLLAGSPPRAHAQIPLTLDEAMKRAQRESAEARALASTIDEADARKKQAPPDTCCARAHPARS